VIRANGDPHNLPAPDPGAVAAATAAAPPLAGHAEMATTRGLGNLDDGGTPSPSPAAAATARPRSWRETLLVNLAIGMAMLVVIVSLSIIYIRWLIVTEPTAAVVVYGDPSLAGARVYVQTDDGHSVLREPVTLGAANDFVTPVLLVPGTYTVRAELDGKVVREAQFRVRPYEGQMFFLSDEARRRAAEGVRDEPPRRAPARPTSQSTGATAASAKPAPWRVYGQVVH
jgi:hypothetical protein